MKQLATSLSRSWIQKLLLVVAGIILFLLGYLCIFVLNDTDTARISYRLEIASVLFAFFIPTILAWSGSRFLCLAFFSPVSIIFSILAAWAANVPSYLLFAAAQVLLSSLLFSLDQRKNAEVIARNVEIEKATNEKNDMELAFKNEGTSISVLFEKYTSYYNLRNLATEFSTTLSLKELSQMIVSKTMELLPHSNWCLLFLPEPQSGSLSLVASKSVEAEGKRKAKGGDLFDFWVLRNKQSLIVTDIQKDFRFDLQKAQETDHVRSVLASPLIHEGKAVGTLRVNSPQALAFSTDDLRLLDAISTLASSAVSNAILFQKTEELAIRDSLTGLYVQRYFLERLSEEHRRSLLTNTPLTLLMCDLDHFKVCNDQYGHGVGDYALAKTSEIISKQANGGIVARYGGEEFAILLPKISIQEGCALAESIRTAIAGMNLSVRRETIPITISIGIASIPSDTLDSEELIRIADRRLYQAKTNGRNQVCGAE